MNKGDIFLQYKTMSEADQRTFDRWLKANIVLSALTAAGLMAMALASANLGPREAVAESPKAAMRASERVKTAHELMIEMVHRLPVEQIDEPF